MGRQSELRILDIEGNSVVRVSGEEPEKWSDFVDGPRDKSFERTDVAKDEAAVL